MTQELIDLRASIVEGRYEDALVIVDELEWMSKKGILLNIESFLVRMLVHLIKNEVEQRLTNSWVASIRDSIIKIQDLNLKENNTSYYIKENEWDSRLEMAFKDAIFEASTEVANGAYKPRQLRQILDESRILTRANELLRLTYLHSNQTLRDAINQEFIKLPGGEDWVD
ncbi:DUF29 family protein [Kamptonema sp. UHCC 0994]|uniref:DUF29 family protein n=1 Tax=Kamptonema sp. UHCC 0994 TaxID=3031329 RepID=UPI0023B89441|nr:DUF29 family protein [Kamptonema sp. UHCC 0994]MDF0552991.1 DUF29 family protein [Kamptonema sp. UHCC 0994]